MIKLTEGMVAVTNSLKAYGKQDQIINQKIKQARL